MYVTPLGNAGTFVWPKSLYPHATTVPSLRRARLWYKPPATAVYVTPLGNAGTFVWPKSLLSHATTVPSLRRARL